MLSKRRNPRFKEKPEMDFNITVGIPRFIFIEKSRYMTFVNLQHKFKDCRWYEEGEYKIILVKKETGLTLLCELISKVNKNLQNSLKMQCDDDDNTVNWGNGE